MLRGLMQDDYQLTLQHALWRLRTVCADGEVVTLREPDRLDRMRYGDMVERVDRLAAGLAALGVQPGDRVGTFCWNTQEHLEAYLAIPCMGAVLHTLNIRLFPEQLSYIINHAEDRIVIADDSLVPLLAKVIDEIDGVEKFIVVGDGDASALGGEDRVLRYGDVIASGSADFSYPEIEDEKRAAALCYTSGTTGNPKGVLYSHRSAVLHALGACTTDALGVGARDRILPIVPMFHANAWGLPYAAVMSGASLIMPNRFLQAEPLAKLIENERITVAGAVPTIWLDLLRYADQHKPDLTSLRMVPCGGAAVPRALMQAFEERHDVVVTQAWGMTETSPLGSVAHPPLGLEGEERWEYKVTAGRLTPLVEGRIMGEDGSEVPWDGEQTGELEVRGPWVAANYYNDDTSPEKFHDGWLRTGDVAAITPDGYIRITDRAKDVIKSGGEWISSVDLENELMAFEGVAEAAVIAHPDERWSERPLACVVPEPGASVDAEALRAHLEERVARWWVPERFAFIDEVPKTSVGKFDKKVLRKRLAEGELEVQEVGAPAAKA